MSNSNKVLAGFVTLSFVLASVFVSAISMHGSMPECPLMSGVQSVCTMGEVLTFAVVGSDIVRVVFAPFVTLFAGFFVYSEALNRVRKKNDLVKLFDHIRQSLSDGILHSKVYRA